MNLYKHRFFIILLSTLEKTCLFLKLFFKKLLLPLLLLMTTNCAYHFSRFEQLPGGYDQISVPIFINRTYETGIETYFTDALITEIERSKIAKVTPKSHAQVTLEGIISNIKYDHITIEGRGTALDIPTGSVLTTQYRITITAQLILKRNSDHKILWEGQLQKEKNYLAPQVGLPTINSVNPLYNHSARQENIRLIAKDMMIEVLDRMTENF